MIQQLNLQPAKIFAAFTCLILTFNASAQSPDMEASKDHPMLSRIPGFYITDYSSNFNSHVFPDDPKKEEDHGKTIEGKLTYITYTFDSESGRTCPSTLQVLRNYSAAVAKLGGTKVAESTSPGASRWYTGLIKKNGKEVWVHVGEFFNDNNGNGGEGMGYRLYVTEVEQMQQEVSASDIFDAISNSGFIALDINFDNGKATVKTESMPLIEQLVQALKSNSSLNVSIEGHTDNVGDAAANKKLSEQRAKAVMDLLVAKGIAASRLSSKGWGQEKPVADNRTEEGKARNRRVEIVKK